MSLRISTEAGEVLRCRKQPSIASFYSDDSADGRRNWSLPWFGLKIYVLYHVVSELNNQNCWETKFGGLNISLHLDWRNVMFLTIQMLANQREHLPDETPAVTIRGSSVSLRGSGQKPPAEMRRWLAGDGHCFDAWSIRNPSAPGIQSADGFEYEGNWNFTKDAAQACLVEWCHETNGC